MKYLANGISLQKYGNQSVKYGATGIQFAQTYLAAPVLQDKFSYDKIIAALKKAVKAQGHKFISANLCLDDRCGKRIAFEVVFAKNWARIYK
jgi:hypothetical protein